MMRKLLAASVMLCFFSVAADAKGPSDYPNHVPACAADPADRVADFSIPTNSLRYDGKSVYPILKSFGIKTIIRYYDYDDETEPCKTLFNDEAEAIIHNGFQISVVFQHNNGSPSTFFNKTRGKNDAERALDLARHNGQPPNTIIFFGVDGPDDMVEGALDLYVLLRGGPITPEFRKVHSKLDDDAVRHYNDFLQYAPERFGSDLNLVHGKDVLPYVQKNFLPYVVKYFESVANVFKASSAAGGPAYKIGVYGSGLVCEEMLKYPDLVSDCWLAQSVGWPNYDSFRNAAGPKWTLLQKNPTYCDPDHWRNARVKKTPDPDKKKTWVGFDFNLVRADKADDFGQWKSKLAGTKEFKRSNDCPMLKPLPNDDGSNH